MNEVSWSASRGRLWVRLAFGPPVLWRPRVETFRMEDYGTKGRMWRVGWLLWLVSVARADG